MAQSGFYGLAGGDRLLLMDTVAVCTLFDERDDIYHF